MLPEQPGGSGDACGEPDESKSPAAPLTAIWHALPAGVERRWPLRSPRHDGAGAHRGNRSVVDHAPAFSFGRVSRTRTSCACVWFLTVPCFRLRRLVASTSLTRSHRNGPRRRAGSRKYIARVGTNRHAAYGSLAADIVEPIEVRIGQERDAGETLRSGYGARSLQAFGEIAYGFDLGRRRSSPSSISPMSTCATTLPPRPAAAPRSGVPIARDAGHRRRGVGYGRAGRRARALYGGRLAQPAATTPSTRGSACAFDRCRASRLAMNGRIPLRHRAAHRRASHQRHRR